MPDNFDKEAVREYLALHGKLAKREADPAVRQATERLFRENGLEREPGISAFRQLVELVVAADPDHLNRHLKPGEKRFTEKEVEERLGEMVTGLGGSEGARTLIRTIRKDFVADKLLARLTVDDHPEKPSGPPETTEALEQRMGDEWFRNEVSHYFREMKGKHGDAYAKRVGMSAEDREHWNGEVRSVENADHMDVERALAKLTGKSPVLTLSAAASEQVRAEEEREPTPTMEDDVAAAFKQLSQDTQEDNS